MYNGTVCNTDLTDTFLQESRFQCSCRFFNFFAGIGLCEFLHHDHVALVYRCDEILAVAAKMSSGQFQDIIILASRRFHDHDHSGHICLNMQLLGTAVDIHQQQIIQQQILDEIVLIKSLLIGHQQILDLKRNHFADHIDILTGTSGYENILQLLLIIDLEILISLDLLGIRR